MLSGGIYISIVPGAYEPTMFQTVSPFKGDLLGLVRDSLLLDDNDPIQSPILTS